MQLADLDYALPPELIAQVPVPERTEARLLVLARDGTPLRHAHVRDLPALLRPGDLLVLNDARVIPARVRGRRPSGGRLELLFVQPLGSDAEWEVLVRGSPRPGERVHLPDADASWVAPLGRGRWRLRIAVAGSVVAWLERVGEVPLSPYIHRPAGPTPADAERYQTVFARVPGAVAAPRPGCTSRPSSWRRSRGPASDTRRSPSTWGRAPFCRCVPRRRRRQRCCRSATSSLRPRSRASPRHAPPAGASWRWGRPWCARSSRPLLAVR